MFIDLPNRTRPRNLFLHSIKNKVYNKLFELLTEYVFKHKIEVSRSTPNQYDAWLEENKIRLYAFQVNPKGKWEYFFVSKKSATFFKLCCA